MEATYFSVLQILMKINIFWNSGEQECWKSWYSTTLHNTATQHRICYFNISTFVGASCTAGFAWRLNKCEGTHCCTTACYTQVHNEKFAKLKLIILTNQQHTFQTLSLIHKLESNHISATICHLYNLAASSYNEKHTVLYYAYMTLAHIFHIATQSIIN